MVARDTEKSARAVTQLAGLGARAVAVRADVTRAGEVVPGLHERVLERTPAVRWGVPDDVQGIAVFLAGHASDFITGTAIPVDGGYSVMG